MLVMCSQGHCSEASKKKTNEQKHYILCIYLDNLNSCIIQSNQKYASFTSIDLCVCIDLYTKTELYHLTYNMKLKQGASYSFPYTHGWRSKTASFSH